MLGHAKKSAVTIRTAGLAATLALAATMAMTTAAAAENQAATATTPAPIFPVGVWLQPPERAADYKMMGVNFYLGLYNGPTAEQVAKLRAAGMPFYSALNEYARESLLADPLALGWLLPDEPDNAVKNEATGGYDAPVTPEAIQVLADTYRDIDPERPIHLNLGMGVAYNAWHGRGARTGRAEDYPGYADAADSVSFDIYPVSTGLDAVRGRLEYIALGVANLRDAARDAIPVWAVIETAAVGAPARVTPAQLRAEVWLALAAGARGIVYYAHEHVPAFVESALLAHPEIRAEVENLNHEMRKHARLLLTVDRPPNDRGAEVAGWRLDPLAIGVVDRLLEREDPLVLLSVRDVDAEGARYLLVSSLSGETQAGVRIKVDGEVARGPGAVAVGVGGSVATADAVLVDGLLTLDLPPYATKIYRLAYPADPLNE